MSSFRNGLLLCTITMLLAPGVQAQSNSCELLKQTLASRIPPEIKGYAMDDVPARTPVPSGGKVIGTCEGGARKVVYRRFGGPPLVVDGAASTTPAAASAPAPVAVQPKEVPKSKPEPVVPPKPVPPPVASAPAPKPAPVAVPPKPALAPASVPAPVLRPAPVASAPAPVVTPVAPLVTRAAPTPQPVEPAAVPLSPAPSSDDGEPGFFSTYGTWLWLLLALPLVAWLWAWVSHRLAYDEAGLPRGPRL